MNPPKVFFWEGKPRAIGDGLAPLVRIGFSWFS